MAFTNKLWLGALYVALGCSPAAQPGGVPASPSAPPPKPCESKGTEFMLHIDRQRYPHIQFRMDQFVVPESAREAFLEATQRNFAFIRTLPGFLGHIVLEKSGGPTRFNLSTIAAWESPEAIDAAVAKVQAYYQSIGFNPPAFMREHAIEGELGNFDAPLALQE
ncbi:MAG: antibiotic biosynthesis monooxygenase family protein [Polyangiaceae bacterium]